MRPGLEEMTEFTSEEYNRQIEELFDRHPSVQSGGFSPKTYKSGIASMEEFGRQLGEPWRSYRCVHIAGTNGKGSVASFLASALAAAGFRTGLYTSPHMIDFRERAKLLDGGPLEMISREEVMDFLNRTQGITAGLSFFEITTGMALDYFRKRHAEWAVIEVGLGGRLDSTNIITPEISVITSIGLDHCALLGNTRAKIAAEKAGIFKRGVPALVWGHDKETDSVFEKISGKVGAPLYYADEIIPNLVPEELLSKMDLQGEYQADNLRTCLAALLLLQKRTGISTGVNGQVLSFSSEAEEPLLSKASGANGPIPSMERALSPALREALQHTASRTGLHGRWERIMNKPEVICDIAHNPPALRRNFAALERSGKPLTIVFGIMVDKDLDSIASLMPSRARYILCAPDTPRAMKVENLYAKLSNLRPELDLQTAPSVKQAFRKAVAEAGDDGLVYIGGSNFVLAELFYEK